jgi:hypothetical protein
MNSPTFVDKGKERGQVPTDPGPSSVLLSYPHHSSDTLVYGATSQSSAIKSVGSAFETMSVPSPQ